MNKLLMLFRRIFEAELTKIRNADEKKYQLLEKEIVNSMLDEKRAITSAKSYVKRQEPKRA